MKPVKYDCGKVRCINENISIQLLYHQTGQWNARSLLMTAPIFPNPLPQKSILGPDPTNHIMLGYSSADGNKLKMVPQSC